MGVEIFDGGAAGDFYVDVCRAIKSDPTTSDTMVVMLTAQAQQRDRERGMAAGADVYFTKPFSPLALLDLVEQVRQAPAGADEPDG